MIHWPRNKEARRILLSFHSLGSYEPLVSNHFPLLRKLESEKNDLGAAVNMMF